GRGDAVMAQQQRQRAAVDVRPERGVRLQRLQLRTEQQDVALPAVVQRLLAHAVARQRQRALLTIPQGERKHADAGLQGTLDTPGGDARQQGFGIGVPAPRWRGVLRAKAFAQGEVVVDLAVEHDDMAAVGRMHGLVAGRGKVEDRQASLCQRHAGGFVAPFATVVGAAVAEPGRHRPRLRQQRILGATVPLPEAGHAAHQACPARRSMSASRGTCASRLYSASTRARPAAPMRWRSAGLAINRSNASRHAASSVARKPFSPWCTMLTLTPTGEATTGRPQAMYWMIL